MISYYKSYVYDLQPMPSEATHFFQITDVRNSIYKITMFQLKFI